MADVVCWKKGKKIKLLRIRIKLYFIFIAHHYGYKSLHLYLVLVLLQRLWTFPNIGKKGKIGKNSIHKSNNHFPGTKSFVFVFLIIFFIIIKYPSKCRSESILLIIFFIFPFFIPYCRWGKLLCHGIKRSKKNLIIIFPLLDCNVEILL